MNTTQHPVRGYHTDDSQNFTEFIVHGELNNDKFRLYYFHTHFMKGFVLFPHLGKGMTTFLL